MKKAYQPKQNEQGQSMVELALTITFLMVLLAGTIDLGRAFFVWLGMRDAAQEGAVYGSFNPAITKDQIKTYVVSLIKNDVVKDPAAAINVVPEYYGDRCLGFHPAAEDPNINKPNSITVLVEYTNFPISMPFLGALIGDQITIRAKITDTIIAPKCVAH